MSELWYLLIAPNGEERWVKKSDVQALIDLGLIEEGTNERGDAVLRVTEAGYQEGERL